LDNFDQLKKALDVILLELSEIRSEITRLKEASVNQKQISDVQARIGELEKQILKGPIPLVITPPSAVPKEEIPSPTTIPKDLKFDVPSSKPPEPKISPPSGIPPPPEIHPLPSIPKPPIIVPPPLTPVEEKIPKAKPPPLPPMPPRVEPKPVIRPKPPPPPPKPPRQPFDWDKFEARLIFWGVRVAALFAVLSVGYLLSMGFGKLGLFGKAMSVYCAFAAMLITGVVFERWEKYKTWARIMIAGGWSGIYITSFFIYYLPQARLIPDAFMDVVLLSCIAVGMIAHSFKYRSESLTTLTFFIAFITISLSIKFTNQTLFSLFSNTVLAVSMLVIFYRMRWYRLALLCVNACYGAHTLWLSPLVPVFRASGGHDTEFWTGLAMLGIYWITFTLAVVIVKPRDKKEETSALWLTALNYAEFVGVFRYHVGSAHPEMRWYFTAMMALLYIILSFLAYSRKRQNLYTLNLIIAALSATMTVYFRFLGGNWLAVMWLMEAEALYLAGILGDERRFRWIGIANFVVVGWWLLFKDIYRSDSVSLFHFSFYTRTLIFGTVAVFFYINSILRRTFSTRISLENKYSFVFAYSASLLWLILTMKNWYPDDLLKAGVVGAALSFMLMETGIRTKDFHFRMQGLGYAFLSVLWALTPLMMGESYYEGYTIYYRVGCEAAVIAFAYAVFARLHKITQTAGQTRSIEVGATVFSATAGTLILIVTLRQELIVSRPMFIAVTWLATAVALLEVGFAFKSRFLRYQSAALCALAFIYALLYNLDVNLPGSSLMEGAIARGLSSRLVTLGLCIGAMYYIHERFFRGEPEKIPYLKNVSPSDALSWLAGTLVILLIQRELWIRAPAWVSEGWLAPMAVFLYMARRRKSLNFLAQGFLTSIIIFLWTMIVTISAQSEDFVAQLESWRIWAASPIIAVYYGMFALLFARSEAILGADRAKISSPLRDIFSWQGSMLLLALVTVEVNGVSPALTTAIWIGIVIILYEVGRHLENVSLKSQGFLLAILTFCRAGVINLDREYGHIFNTSISGRTASLVYIIAGLYYLYIRLIKSEKATPARISEHDFGKILSYLALILLVLLVYAEMPARWAPAGWGFIMLAVMLAGIFLREPHLVYQALIMVIPISLGILFLDFPRHAGQSRVGAGVAIGTLFIARIVWQVGMFNRRDKLGPDFQTGFLAGASRHYFSMPAAILLAILIPLEFHGPLAKYLTIVWACEGFFLMMLGFALKDRILRFSGLILLAFCILKVFYDLWVLDIGRVFKVIALIGLSGILIAIGLIYSRYRDSIRKTLTE